MKITDRLFPPTTPPSAVHREPLLRPHLASSGTLTRMLKQDSMPTADLKRMLAMEASRPAPRYVIVRKLIARILSRERERMVKAAYGKLTP